MSTSNWEELKRRLIEGDSEALTDLQAALDREFSRGWSRHRGSDTRMDVLHSVLLTVLKCRQQERLQAIRNLRAYCARVLVLERTRALSAHSGLSISSEEVRDDSAEDLLENLVRAEIRAEIRRVLARLPIAQSEVLILADVVDMTVPQITDWYARQGRNKSRSAVEALLKRGRLALRTMLAFRLIDSA